MTVQGTSPADADLGEFRLTIAGRELSVLHRRALVSWLDEQDYLSSEGRSRYGLILWPASIALALEIGQRAADFSGRRVLELGAGTGLSGIAAAAIGARVVQTDRDEDALELSARNAARNEVNIEHRRADWSSWSDHERYDWVIGSDILYRTSLHDQLRDLFESFHGAGARLLVADPMRPASLQFLERLEGEGWTVALTRWTIGEGDAGRVIGVFDLQRG